jgi:hypothetical protein
MLTKRGVTYVVMDGVDAMGDAAVAYVGYIQKMFWPAGLIVFYPHPGKHLVWWQFGGALVLLLVISGAALL